MDFRTEIEQHASTMQNKVAQQLQEIHRLQERVITLEDNINNLNTDITDLNQALSPQIQELATKKELIAQWQSTLAEHENTLLANQMLIAIQESVEENQSKIEQRLDVLGKEKVEILESINQFHRDHPYLGVEIGARLKKDLLAKEAHLIQVSNQIDQIEAIQTKMNVIVKFFLNLLHSWGWRSDPLAEEQKKLMRIAQDIIQITHSLEEYQTNHTKLDALHEQNDQITTEKRQLLQDKAQIEQIEATKKAIAASQQTIRQLSLQIKNTQADCNHLQKQIRQKKLDTKASEQQALIQEKNETLDKLREKAEQLAEIDSPTRAALKTGLTDALVQAITHHASYIRNQEAYRNTQSTTHFFKPVSGKTGPNQATHDTPNYIALCNLQTAIISYKNGLTPKKVEYRVMSQIAAKLLLWQMAESTTNSHMTMSERNSAHQKLNTEIADLVSEIPSDNPLHASLHFMEALTYPLEPVEEASTKKTKRMTK